jgi:hypothetical protein
MSAKHRPTGPGVVAPEPSKLRTGVRAILSNYDIDVDTPKPEHIRFLASKVLPLIAGRCARVWIQGSASHTGTDAHNMALSRRRADRVADYLSSRGVPRGQLQIDAIGESMANPRIREFAGDRGVALLATQLVYPQIPRPVTVRPCAPPSTTRLFRLRLVGGFSGGQQWNIDRLYFQIQNRESGVTSTYSYLGLGLGISLKPIGATLPGPWNDFTTTGPMAITQFEGPARFSTGGSGPISVNWFNMMGLPPGVATIPRSLPIDTGWSLAFALSFSVGRLTLRETGYYRD